MGIGDMSGQNLAWVFVVSHCSLAEALHGRAVTYAVMRLCS
jgi:hypothetical protein